MPVCSLCRPTSCFLQRRLCFVSCPASCGARCRGRCVRVTCGCRCGRDHTAALSPACREPRAAPCCCSSSYWPTVCGTALWWTRDTGTGISIFPCLIVFVFTLTLPVLQFNLVLNFTKEQYLSISMSFLFMPLYFFLPLHLSHRFSYRLL